jgi:hypothetical protein
MEKGIVCDEDRESSDEPANTFVHVPVGATASDPAYETTFVPVVERQKALAHSASPPQATPDCLAQVPPARQRLLWH